MTLANKVLIALVAAVFAGIILNLNEMTAVPWVNDYLINGVFDTVGQLFVSALKMLIVPLILFSLIPGILGIGDIRLLGKVGGKSFALYITTTAIAISTAIAFASISDIGTGLSIPLTESFEGKEASKSFKEIIIGIIPSNIIAAMANADTLAIIFVSILFGIALLIEAKKTVDLIKFIDQMNIVVLRVVELVMIFAPYAVFCLVAKAVSELGFRLIWEVSGYFVVLVTALLFHAFVTQMIILKLFTGLSITTFLKKMRNVQLFAFSTSSSAATIPVTLRTVQQRLGVDRAIASFNVPFGATINMDGTAIMQGVATVFIANLYGIELGLTGYITVIITAVLASVGTAAVPGVGLVMLSLVFNQVGLPIEAIGYIIGVDRILDMIRTAVNVTGDAMVSTVVAKSENRLDTDVYNNMEAGVIDDDMVCLLYTSDAADD